MSAHIGLCLTDELDAAMAYAVQFGLAPGSVGTLTEWAIPDALHVVSVDAYDRDADFAHGDDGALRDDGADIIIYEDEDPRGRPHTTWRVVSQRAVDALQLLRSVGPIGVRCAMERGYLS